MSARFLHGEASFVINNCLELILGGCLSYFPTVLANHLALLRWPFPRQLIIWSPSIVILNSDTFHLHLKNNFHSSPSLPFKILLSNLHGLMGALYSTYCFLVLPFFLSSHPSTGVHRVNPLYVGSSVSLVCVMTCSLLVWL